MQQVTAHAQNGQAPPTHGFRPLWRGWPLIALAIICVICYANTAAGYFYSDDFPFLKMVGAVDKVGPGILQTFFGTRCADFQAFLYCYRPLPNVIFLVEYLLAGVKPFWYHVANIACHAGCSMLVYTTATQLLRNAQQPKLIAFVAAAAFAACPLYGEIVYGPTNIVTGAGALFFLSALTLYLTWLEAPTRRVLVASVICFALSLFSKELAAILPIILACCCAKQGGSMRSLIPYGLVFAAFLAIRTAVLGPIVGGYSGMIGDLMSDQWTLRLFNTQWPAYCFFPFNAEAFSPTTLLKTILSAAYAVLLVLGALRLSDKTRRPLHRESAILAVWMVLSLIPVLTVWHIESGLVGGRHAQVSAIPFFILAALLTYTMRHRRVWVGAWTVIVSIFAYANVCNNQVYVHASRESYQVKEAVAAEMAKLKAGQRLFFLNPPFQTKGLYLFNTAIMFRAMCEPPVSKIPYNNRILLNSHWFNTNYNQCSLSRIKALTDDPTVRAVYWDQEHSQLEHFDGSTGSGLREIRLLPNYRERNQFNQLARFSFFIDPAILNSEVDFIEVDVSSKATAQAPKVKPALSVRWQTEAVPQFTEDNASYLPVTADGITRHYQIPLSNTLRWWLQKKNGSLELRLPSAGFNNTAANFSAKGWRLVVPALSISDGRADNDGVYDVAAAGFAINYDATKVRNAKTIIVEVSRPGSILEEGVVLGRRNYDRKDKALIRREFLQTAGSIKFGPKELAKSGIYEIEVGTMDANGNLGYFSDPLFIRVNGQGERSI